MHRLEILQGDWVERLNTLPDESAQCCVTSPPYWGLRDYGVAGQLGLEKTPQEYVDKLVAGFQEVRRVLKDDGTLWLNLGDSYSGSGKARGGGGCGPTSSKQVTNRGAYFEINGEQETPGIKPKDLVGIPWRAAFALQADGWWLRSDIIWHKPNPMPESVTDRPTKAHEYIFLMTKSQKYFYDADAIRESSLDGADDVRRISQQVSSNKSTPDSKRNGIRMRRSDDLKNYGMGVKGQGGLYGPRTTHPNGRNKRDVWTVQSAPCKEAHFATFPPDLIKPCILAGSRPGDTILDPFGGSGTTGMVALELGRKAVLIELNPDYVNLMQVRCDVTAGLPL
jgi:DNA modification methylase